MMSLGYHLAWNYSQLNSVFNNFFILMMEKTSKLCIVGLMWGENISHQWISRMGVTACNMESFHIVTSSYHLLTKQNLSIESRPPTSWYVLFPAKHIQMVRHNIILSRYICQFVLKHTVFIPPEQRSCWGVYWFHSVRLCVRLSVRPSVPPAVSAL